MKTLKLLFICLLIFPITVNSQKRKKKIKKPVITITDSLYHGLKWRNIGPFRGGRSVTSTGVIGNIRRQIQRSLNTFIRLIVG